MGCRGRLGHDRRRGVGRLFILQRSFRRCLLTFLRAGFFPRVHLGVSFMSARLLRTTILAVLFTGLAAARLAAAEEPKPPATPTGTPAGGEAEEISKVLQEAWPDRPEWLDMYTAILDDEAMGPKYGWFRTAVTQTRFDWDATRKRYDRDGDSRIDRKEFPGSDADFPRLDRDRDGASPADFDFSTSDSPPSPARSCSPGSIATATASSHARSSRRSSGRGLRRGGLSVAVGSRGGLPGAPEHVRGDRPQQGDADSRVVPAGDRFAPAWTQARRDGTRLHPEDQ